MPSTDEVMLDLLKSTIQFTTPEGQYEGKVRLVCPVTKKLIIEKVVFLPKQLYMGTLTFQFHEILSHSIINRPLQTESDAKEENCTFYSHIPTKTNDNDCFIDDEQSEIDNNEDRFYSDDLLEEEYILNLPPILAGKLPVESIILDKIDEEFHLAIKHIQLQNSIGLCLEGPKLDRHGILSWLNISTSSCTFLFDIENLSSECFCHGLKSILENPKIEKVIHDCRESSDILYHKYGVKLVNVFDTQVADLIIKMQILKDTKLNRHVSPLNSSLHTYLEIPEEFLYKPKTFRTYEENVLFSRLRPLRKHQRDLLIKNVIYLQFLKNQLNFALLNPFRRAVKVYLHSLQAFTDRELLLRPIVKEEVPPELLMEGIQVVKFSEFVNVPPIVSSGPPFRELKNPVEKYINYCDQYKHIDNISLDSTLSSSVDEKIVQNEPIMVEENINTASRDVIKNCIFINNVDESKSNKCHRNQDRLSTVSSNSKIDYIRGSNSLNSRFTKVMELKVLSESSKDSVCDNVGDLLESDQHIPLVVETINNKMEQQFERAGNKFRNFYSFSDPDDTPESSMSSTSDLIDEEPPWALLRSQSPNSCSDETNLKLKFIPAGFQKQG